jgi:hypothetical protein
MKSSGFDVLEILTPGKLDVDIVQNKLRSGELDLTAQPFLHEILVKRAEELAAPFQQFLAQNHLSSHLWVVARKVDVV